MEANGKRLLIISICLVLVSVALPFWVTFSKETTPPPIVLKYGGINPEGSWPEIYGHKLWRDDVKKATGGRVTFEEYNAQTLVKTPHTWRSVETGIADVTSATHVALPGLCPLTEVMALPFLPFKSSSQASGILWKLYEEFPSIRDEFKVHQVTHFVIGLGNHIISRNKLLKTMDDFKGVKIRATGGALAPEQLKLLGAVPVTMPVTEVYLNFQKGVMDAVVGNWDFTIFTKLYEVGQYYTYVPVNGFVISSLINKGKWNSLPPDIQQIIDKQSGLWRSEELGYQQFDSAFDRAKKLIKDQGFQMTEYTVSPEELQKWIKVSAYPLWDKWVKDSTAKGHPESQKILDRILQLIETYKPSYKPGYKP
jgi:TRAP-type C4-dicarboxylate transport system substrate-binding protein